MKFNQQKTFRFSNAPVNFFGGSIEGAKQMAKWQGEAAKVSWKSDSVKQVWKKREDKQTSNFIELQQGTRNSSKWLRKHAWKQDGDWYWSPGFDRESTFYPPMPVKKQVKTEEVDSLSSAFSKVSLL